MSFHAPTSDRRDDVRTLLLALAAVLTILICALTVLYASGAVDLGSGDSDPVITTDPGAVVSTAG